MTTVQEPLAGPNLSSPFFPFKSHISDLKSPAVSSPLDTRPDHPRGMIPNGDEPEPAASPRPSADRCRFTFSDGRQCGMHRASFCVHHASKRASPDGAEGAPQPALQDTEIEPFCADLTTATAINAALAQVFRLLAQGRIARQNAVAFGYLAQLLLQTLPGVRGEFVSAFGHSAWNANLKMRSASSARSLSNQGTSEQVAPPSDETIPANAIHTFQPPPARSVPAQGTPVQIEAIEATPAPTTPASPPMPPEVRATAVASRPLASASASLEAKNPAVPDAQSIPQDRPPEIRISAAASGAPPLNHAKRRANIAQDAPVLPALRKPAIQPLSSSGQAAKTTNQLGSVSPPPAPSAAPGHRTDPYAPASWSRRSRPDPFPKRSRDKFERMARTLSSFGLRHWHHLQHSKSFFLE